VRLSDLDRCWVILHTANDVWRTLDAGTVAAYFAKGVGAAGVRNSAGPQTRPKIPSIKTR
jgi:hypothetical protein